MPSCGFIKKTVYHQDLKSTHFICRNILQSNSFSEKQLCFQDSLNTPFFDPDFTRLKSFAQGNAIVKSIYKFKRLKHSLITAHQSAKLIIEPSLRVKFHEKYIQPSQSNPNTYLFLAIGALLLAAILIIVGLNQAIGSLSAILALSAIVLIILAAIFLLNWIVQLIQNKT
jgi:hypothetical protein